jgi:2-polyprenyl-3-methyl-5-hydroxy-6-metoxy-1,4-benzoquinol methylase
MKQIGSWDSVLDVGAGLGVFLFELLCHGKVCAVEPNKQSQRFLKDRLCVSCFDSLYEVPTTHDVVSCIHTLEHVEDPESFLLNLGAVTQSGGRLFLEVPDAKEFDYLPPDHDEFNSCHCTFFTPETLMWLVQDAGFKVTDLHMVRTKARDLSRIMLLAEKV